MNTADRLIELATFYHREAGRCARGRAYLGAIVMQVSALEAALQAMCSMYIADVKKTPTWQKKRFRGRRNRALELTLEQLIDIADEMSSFPSKKVTWAGKTHDAGWLLARDSRIAQHGSPRQKSARAGRIDEGCERRLRRSL